MPGLTRQSIDLRKNFLAKKMDARVKPAHDELAKQLKLAPMGLDHANRVYSTCALKLPELGYTRVRVVHLLRKVFRRQMDCRSSQVKPGNDTAS